MVKKDHLSDNSPKIQKILKHRRKFIRFTNKKGMPEFLKVFLQRRYVNYLRKRRSLGEGEIMNELILAYKFRHDHRDEIDTKEKIIPLFEEAYNEFKLPKTIGYYAITLIQNEFRRKGDPKRGLSMMNEEIDKGNYHAIRYYYEYSRIRYTKKETGYAYDIEFRKAFELLSKLVDLQVATKYETITYNAFKSIQNEPFIDDLEKGKHDDAWKVGEAIKNEYENNKDHHYTDDLVLFKWFIEKYYNASVKAGSIEGAYRTGNFLFNSLSTDDIDDKHKNRDVLKYYNIAAEKDHPQAIYNIGVIYEKGYDGQTIDLKKAKEYYKRAADLGLDTAKKKLTELK